MPDSPFRLDARTMYDRMLAGDQYIANEAEIFEAADRAADLTTAYNATSHRDGDRQRKLLEELLGSIGEHVTIRAPFNVDLGFNIHVGDRFFANFGLTALDVAEIRIGDDVLVGPNVQLLTPTHPIEPEPRRQKWEGAEPITIGNNVWLGGGVIVCPGVTIGENSVIGAGSVVTRDVPPNTVAVGNPARVIKQI